MHAILAIFSCAFAAAGTSSNQDDKSQAVTQRPKLQYLGEEGKAMYEPMETSEAKFIARLEVKSQGMECVVFLDQKAEGYKTIVGLETCEGGKPCKANTPVTGAQLDAVHLCATQVGRIFLKNELYPQLMFLGNNAHQKDKAGNMELGRNEPNYPHIHIYGRGVNEFAYLVGVPLGGENFPQPGEAIKHQDNRPLRKWKDLGEDKQKELAIEFAKQLQELEINNEMHSDVGIKEIKQELEKK